MGPHFFKCGKECVGDRLLAKRQKLQWGRTFSSAERGELGKAATAAFLLQWGRTFSSAESPEQLRRDHRRPPASMGPHFFKCGKVTCLVVPRQPMLGFNGAALFQVRKAFERIRTIQLYFSFNGAALFQVRKAVTPTRKQAVPVTLQWGRTFSSAESLPWLAGCRSPPRLQWGRTFSSAERVVADAPRGPADKASMGPHFFKCGKLWRRRKPAWPTDSFNGAALFQVRKEWLQTRPGGLPTKLQWGRTFSSAESCGGVVNRLGPQIASMGPHFFKCGK